MGATEMLRSPSPEAMQAHLAKQPQPWKQVLEPDGVGTLHGEFRVKSWPTHFLIGPNGEILSDAKNPHELRQVIMEVLRL